MKLTHLQSKDLHAGPSGAHGNTFTACFAGRTIVVRTAFSLAVATLLAACGGGASAVDSGATATAAVITRVTTGNTPVTTSPTVLTPVTNSAPTPVENVAIGTVLTDVRLQNTGTTAQTNVPFTFGQAFPAGALSTTDGLAAKLADGTVVRLQTDVKATHADGSIRHAVISGVLPMLASGQTQTLQLAKSTLPAKSSLTPQSLAAVGLTGSVNITVNGVKYTASLTDGLAAANPINWLSGSVANEWIVNAPLKNASGVVHPLLTARFDVRWYSGLTKQARVEFVVENNKTFVSASGYTYDVNLELGGKSVYSKNAMTHYSRSRWHQTFWWNTAPALNVQLNTAYLIASKAVSNYDRTFAPTDVELNQLAATVDSTNTGPMAIGPVNPYMGTTGGRGDIGSLPVWSVMYLLSMDQRAKNVMMAAADGSGSWSIHYRDENTGYPVRTDNETNKRISTHGNLNWTGPLPVPRCVNNDNTKCETPYTADTAHQPSLVYLPYLVTGDYYYLEELQFWAASNPLETDPGNSGLGQGLVRWQQVRGQAWSLRTLGHVAFITPDAHPLKSYFVKQVDNNLNFYNTTYVTGNPNKLGAYDGSGEGAFQSSTSAPWQDDFLTWSFGYLAELGFTKANTILQWKAQYPVGRMTSPDFCWVMASSYGLHFRDNDTGPVFDSFDKLFKSNFASDMVYNDNVVQIANPVGSKLSDLSCGSQAQANWLGKANGGIWPVGQMVGYANSALGYPANMQPALAVAASAGAPNASKAWTTFMARASKPDYKSAPQWAIIPR